jgi:hypothetical protein
MLRGQGRSESANDEAEKTPKNQKFDHISFKDIGYNNVYVKVSTVYHINISRYLTCLLDQIPCNSYETNESQMALKGVSWLSIVEKSIRH